MGDGESERIGPADSGRGVLASGDRRPAEGGGDAADALRIEHVHTAMARPGGGG